MTGTQQSEMSIEETIRRERGSYNKMKRGCFVIGG
jgi:hypothetical protein